MRHLPLLLALLLVPGLAACERSDNEQLPSATSTTVSTATSESASRRTGAVAVDELIDLLDHGNEAAVRERLNAFPEPCSANPQGLGDPPRCPPGIPDGATIDTIRLVVCHRSYPGADDDNLLAERLPYDRDLYAVFQHAGGRLFQFVPRGEYSLVFVNEKGGSERYEVTSEGRVNGIWFSCGPAQEVLPDMLQDAQGFLVPPLYPLPTPTPTPRPDSAGYPPGYDTGIIGINVVVDAINSRDPNRVAAHFSLHPIGCITEPVGIPSPPFCKDGQPAGTPVPVMPVSSCEGEYWEEWELPRLFEDQRLEGRLYAAYRGRAPYNGFPASEHIIVFRSNDGRGFQVSIIGGRIVGVARGCGESAEDIARRIPASEFVLPPPR